MRRSIRPTASKSSALFRERRRTSPIVIQLLRSWFARRSTGDRTGTVDPTRFAPELRPRLVLFFQTYGVRILGPMGELTSLALIGEATIAGKHLRRYRAEFEEGKMIWTVGVAPGGTIASMDPKRE